MRKRRHRHGVGERVKVGLKAAAAAAVVLICFLMWLGQDGGIHNIYEEIVASIQGTSQTSRSVAVKRTDGSVEKMDLETYLLGVVGCEMPPSYELEALKAQAVAARTFVASRGYQVDDSTASQVYMDDTQLQAVWKGSYEESRSRVKEAVEATRGEIMTYEGEAITAFFFASSGGHTADSEEYYSNALPYLRSVESPWDAEVDSDHVSTMTCTKAELAASLGMSAISEIEAPVRYDSGYVKSVRIDGQTFSGRDIREALQLKSSCFSISVQGDQVTFTVEGSGHGVGMSQEGAQGMALEGYDHHEILTHYYTGISFADVYKS